MEMDVNAKAIELAEYFKGLRQSYQAGQLKRDELDSLANVGGKELRCAQLALANRVAEHAMQKREVVLPAPQEERPALPQ